MLIEVLIVSVPSPPTYEVDINGNYITEINVTSPTGIVEINKLENKCLEKTFWNIVEKKYKFISRGH